MYIMEERKRKRGEGEKEKERKKAREGGGNGQDGLEERRVPPKSKRSKTAKSNKHQNGRIKRDPVHRRENTVDSRARGVFMENFFNKISTKIDIKQKFQEL